MKVKGLTLTEMFLTVPPNFEQILGHTRNRK
jgi:hypothetical protein